MAAGVVHSRWTSISITVQTMYMVPHVLDGSLPIFYAGSYFCGLLIGHLLTPDIDQETVTIEEVRMGKAWSWFWQPYAIEYSHRGPSHYFIRGTMTRWSFFNRRLLFLPLVLTLYLLWLAPVNTTTFVGLCFLGNVFQDTIHLALDGFKTYE